MKSLYTSLRDAINRILRAPEVFASIIFFRSPAVCLSPAPTLVTTTSVFSRTVQTFIFVFHRFTSFPRTTLAGFARVAPPSRYLNNYRRNARNSVRPIEISLQWFSSNCCSPSPRRADTRYYFLPRGGKSTNPFFLFTGPSDPIARTAISRPKKKTDA